MTLSSWLRHKFDRALHPGATERALLSELEFVLVDVDLTGTDINQDSVVGLAALPLVDGRFAPDELRYCRFAPSDIHGFADAPGVAEDYQAILEEMAGRTVFTVNPAFVQHMLFQAVSRRQLPAPEGKWLDLSGAAAVVGSDAIPVTSLAYWQAQMKVRGRHAHDAVFDVFAMAQLLQALLAYAEDEGIETLADLMRNQSAEAWMRPF